METNTPPSTQLHNAWPGAFGIVRPAREAMKRNLGTMILLVITTAVISIATQLILRNNDATSVSVSELISFLSATLLSCAEIVTIMASLRNKKIGYSQAFQLGTPMWWRMILLNLLTALTVLGGLILFIVPGIWFALRLSLAPYYLIDRQMGVMEAYKASWHATKGNLGKVWGIIGVMVLMVLPTLTLIGIVATVYLLFMYWPAMPMLYMYLSAKSPADAPAAPAPAAS